MLLYIFVGGGGRRNFPIGTICYDYEGEEEASGSVSYSSFYTVIIVIIIAEKDAGLDCIRVVKRVMAACAPFFFLFCWALDLKYGHQAKETGRENEIRYSTMRLRREERKKNDLDPMAGGKKKNEAYQDLRLILAADRLRCFCGNRVDQNRLTSSPAPHFHHVAKPHSSSWNK